jgi:hypothetical protein
MGISILCRNCLGEGGHLYQGSFGLIFAKFSEYLTQAKEMKM